MNKQLSEDSQTFRRLDLSVKSSLNQLVFAD